MTVLDPFMAGVRPTGLQKGRGGFLRSADDAPYVSDPTGKLVGSRGTRKGEVRRLKYGSPSNRGREIEGDGGLMKWKQRRALLGIGMEQSLQTACTHLLDLVLDSPEFNAAADTIVVAADRIAQTMLAADRGTHGHLLCERADTTLVWADIIPDGQVVGIDTVTQDLVVAAWLAMLERNGLEILAIEASCVDDTWRLAGTLDRIVRLTRALTFVKASGELVVIPANTVIVLDLKFGKCRKAHPIQIASYAQSQPYDTDTEVRGVWPWPIDQTHALIAHGDFGDDTRPVTIELVWVDLVAGREHGGETVVQAKAWAARDDVFSVAQLTTGPITEAEVDAAEAYEFAVEAVSLDATEPSTAAGEGNADSSPRPSPAQLEAGIRKMNAALVDPTVNDLLPRQGMPQHALDELEVDRLNDARRASYDNWGSKRPEARIDDPALWAKIDEHFDELLPLTRVWIAALANQATKHGVPFNRSLRTERAYHIARGLIGLCLRDAGEDEILWAILGMIYGEGMERSRTDLGYWLGAMDATTAKQFGDLVDAWNRDQLVALTDESGALRYQGVLL